VPVGFCVVAVVFIDISNQQELEQANVPGFSRRRFLKAARALPADMPPFVCLFLLLTPLHGWLGRGINATIGMSVIVIRV
jgi:hypothetical protein